MLGYVGLSVPEVQPQDFLSYYRLVEQTGREGLLASCHGLYRGGLLVHLALASLAAGLGAELDLSLVAPESPARAALYSESAGRFLVSVPPAQQARFEELFQGQPCCLLGKVRQEPTLKVSRRGRTLLEAPLNVLQAAWQRRFGDLI
jgi:phosphoribosylformylglycinamidine (FGAM) synthase-like enzyme